LPAAATAVFLLGTTTAVPARSSAESFTPFSRRSSRTEMPRVRATSSSVSPKRSTTVSTLSALSASRALSKFAAKTAPLPTGTRTRAGPRSGGVRLRSSAGFSASTTSIFAPAARATVASVVPAGTSTSSYANGGSGVTSAKPNAAWLRPTIAAARIFGTYRLDSQGSPDSCLISSQ